jgi:hypothetical protein
MERRRLSGEGGGHREQGGRSGRASSVEVKAAAAAGGRRGRGRRGGWKRGAPRGGAEGVCVRGHRDDGAGIARACKRGWRGPQRGPSGAEHQNVDAYTTILKSSIYIYIYI